MTSSVMIPLRDHQLAEHAICWHTAQVADHPVALKAQVWQVVQVYHIHTGVYESQE